VSLSFIGDPFRCDGRAVTTAAPLSAEGRRGRIPGERWGARDTSMHALSAAEVQPKGAATLVARACGSSLGEPFLSRLANQSPRRSIRDHGKSIQTSGERANNPGPHRRGSAPRDDAQPEGLRPKPLTSRLSLTATENVRLAGSGWWARQDGTPPLV